MSIPIVGTPISGDRIRQLLERAHTDRAAREARVQSPSTAHPQHTAPPVSVTPIVPEPDAIGMHGEAITYNAKQQQFIEVVSKGMSCVLIGAAGTGKTTSTRAAIQELIQSGRAGVLQADGHKYLPSHGAPGIAVIAYTRRAVSNIRKVSIADMQGNCITHHKLLEYQPIYYTVVDPITGDERNTMRFEATRNILRTLPASIRTVFIEESSMYSVELFKELMNACPHKPQLVFLGDIQQLPPVFGSAILGYKMLELVTIELTEVYRQALESPIIRLAHRILSGVPIPVEEYPAWEFPEKLKLHAWKKRLSADYALATAAKFFTTNMDHGTYDPDEDMILIPFNKSFGTEELNKHIAQHLARKSHQDVYEIKAGFNNVYLHVGAKVLYDKEDAVIVDIVHNGTYSGKRPAKHSPTLDYWGHDANKTAQVQEAGGELGDFDLDSAIDAAATSDERVRQASHIVKIKMLDSEEEIDLDTAADVNALLMGYALTVHKAQGSEWRRVFLVLHQSHATMTLRELLYTAVTRAREHLYVICEPDTFTKGILNQKIKGNTLLQKAEYFKGKLDINGGTY